MKIRKKKNNPFKQLAILILVLTCVGCKASMDSPRSVEKTNLQTVFRPGEMGYQCFRIPVVIMAKDGSLLAFAEARKTSCSDTGDIDLVMKKSIDNGKNWQPLQVVWDDGDNTCGNPAPVLDEETGTLFLLTTWNLGKDHEKEIIAGESEDTRRVFVSSSVDNGATWSGFKDITISVKPDNWTWYATGPATGIQVKRGAHKGRLVIPCDHLVMGTREAYSHAVYSDDHGKTWTYSGNPQEGTNESTLAEMENGDLMLNMRNYNREIRYRQVAISKDGGKSWINKGVDSTLVEPICQASLISMTYKGKHLLAFSNPATQRKRKSMTIRLSDDNGLSWNKKFIVHDGPSAYSCLVSMGKGKIGILFESGREKPYEGIAFQIINVKEFE